MYTLNEVKKELKDRYNQNIELQLLEECIHIWNIEPVNNEDTQEEYYDDSTIRKLYRGIKLKLSGYSEAIISEILNKTAYKQDEKNIEETDNKVDEEHLKIQLKEKFLNQTNPTKSTASSNVIDFNTRDKRTKYELEIETETVGKPENNPKESSHDKQKLINTISDTIAEKVSSEILNYFKDDEFLNKLDNLGELKRDNEILSKQVIELMKVNSHLEEKNFELELETKSFRQIWKKVYFKAFD
ncbi:MAG: hypothetical protein AB1782_03205 [Cyanobacteriota bacterium]